MSSQESSVISGSDHSRLTGLEGGMTEAQDAEGEVVDEAVGGLGTKDQRKRQRILMPRWRCVWLFVAGRAFPD